MKGKTMSLEKSTMIEDVMKLLIEYGPEKFRESLEMLYNQAMQIERSEVLRAHPYERTEARRGHANGFKPKRFNSSVGTLALQIPQVRGDVSFYPGSLERGTRSEKALKCALAEMYIQGVSTRKVREITEALCGLSVSSSQVSRVTRELDTTLSAFRDRELDDPYPYVYLDARYEKTRHNGRVIDSAVLIAMGVNKRTGLREVLGISTELSEAEVHWRHFLEHLQKRGLKGVELFISDDHSGLKAARLAVYSHIPWQRCQFHFQQNAQAYAPAKSMRKELADAVKAIFNTDSKQEAQTKTETVCKTYADKAPAFCDWLQDNIEEALTVYDYPKSHRRRIRTSNGLERLNQEIKRRTRVARLFPNQESCLRLITAILVEQHETWISGRIYLNFDIDECVVKNDAMPFYRKNVA
jgi:putative transposase